MTNRRKKYSPEFKAQVSLAALKGDKTISEIAQEYEVHSNLIVRWKTQLQKEAGRLFDTSSRKEDELVDIDALYKKIGQLEVERDFLASRPGIIAALRKEGR